MQHAEKKKIRGDYGRVPCISLHPLAAVESLTLINLSRRDIYLKNLVEFAEKRKLKTQLLAKRGRRDSLEELVVRAFQANAARMNQL